MSDTSKKKATVVKVGGLEKYTAGIPVFLATSDGSINFDDLEQPLSYLLTGEGVFLYRVGPVFTTLTEADGLAGLGECDGRLQYKFSPMPVKLARQVVGFFRWAEKEFHSEAIVIMYFNASENKWLIKCPKQTVGAGSANYTMTDTPEGYVRLGTWHSHGNMSAYHSSIDSHDEEKDDGLHLTSGNMLDSKNFKPSISCSIMMGGTRYSLEPKAVFRNIDIEEREMSTTVKYVGNQKTVEPGRKEYSMVFTAGDNLDFPPEWKEQVDALPKKFGSPYSGGYADDDFVSYGLGVPSLPGAGRSTSTGTSYTAQCWRCWAYSHSTSLGDLAFIVEEFRKKENAELRKELEAMEFVNQFGYPEFPDNLYGRYSRTEQLIDAVKGSNTVRTPKMLVLLVMAMRDDHLGDTILQLARLFKEQGCNHGVCLNDEGEAWDDRPLDKGEMPVREFSQSSTTCDWYMPISYSKYPVTASEDYGKYVEEWDKEQVNRVTIYTKFCGNCRKFSMLGSEEKGDCPAWKDGVEPDVFDTRAEDCPKYSKCADTTDIETID